MAPSRSRRRAGLAVLAALLAAGAGFAYALPRTGPVAALVSSAFVGLFILYLWWAIGR